MAHDVAAGLRMTPACARTTRHRWRRKACRSDDPRVCGDDGGSTPRCLGVGDDPRVCGDDALRALGAVVGDG